MSARDEAMRLRAWAEAAGVFSQGCRLEGQGSNDADFSGMFAADIRAALVRKPVTAIGHADSALYGPRVFIYTRRRLTQAEMRAFRESGAMHARPVFRTAPPLGVRGPSAAASLPFETRNGRIACGGSISVGNNREAGTLGALLRGPDGALYGLSCNHVTGGCSNARQGLPIVAPGILDVAAGLRGPQTIGTHSRSLPFIPGDPAAIAAYRDNRDAAVFRIDNPAAHCSFQGSVLDTPPLAAMPLEDMAVEKVGRSTGHTRGVVESCLAGPQRIDYRLTTWHSAEESSPFTGGVFFEPVYIVRGTSGPFAIEGDSGALVVAGRESGKPVAVGMVVGGDRANDVTWMLPLPPVLYALGMTLVSGFGYGP